MSFREFMAASRRAAEKSRAEYLAESEGEDQTA
jgi:hypothetical protein